MGLSCSFQRAGSITVTGSNPGNNPVATSRTGQNGVPSGVLSLADGTASNQAHINYEETFTVAAGAIQQISLKGDNGETDQLNVLLAMTCVKSVELIITSPAVGAGISLIFGPQGATNAAPLWSKPSNTSTSYVVTVTSANATLGATYTNNTQTFTVLSTIAAQTTLFVTGTGAIGTTTLTKASGTGDTTIAFSASIAAPAPFGDAIQSHLTQDAPGPGWVIDATHKLLIISNPSLVAITFWIRVIGY